MIPPFVRTEPNSQIGKPIPFTSGYFHFLELPLEIRKKIYRMLFRCSVPLHPVSEEYKMGRVLANHFHSHPNMPGRTLFPTSLFFVNRQICDEATSALWGDNQIVFQLPKSFNSEFLKLRDEGHTKDSFSRGSTIIPSLGSLNKIRNLVIEVYLLRSTRKDARWVKNTPARPFTNVKKDLASLCEGLDSSSIKQLEVRFNNTRPWTNPNHMKQSFWPISHKPYPWHHSREGYCCGCNLGCDGDRHFSSFEEAQKRCVEAVELDQQVLIPLLKLKGVANFKIVGRITDDWAAFLKKSIESEPGVELDEFEHATPIREGFNAETRKATNKTGGRTKRKRMFSK